MLADISIWNLLLRKLCMSRFVSTLSRFLWYMFCPLPPLLLSFFPFLQPTHRVLSALLYHHYQAHARVKTPAFLSAYILFKQTSRLLSGIIPTSHPHIRVLLPSVPPSPGLFHISIHFFYHSHYLRAYLIPGVSCHHIHASVRSITHPHTYTHRHFHRASLESQGSITTSKANSPASATRTTTSSPVYIPYLPPLHPYHTYHILNWNLIGTTTHSHNRYLTHSQTHHTGIQTLGFLILKLKSPPTYTYYLVQ